MEKIYLIGSFTNPDWREEIIKKIPNRKFENPINHDQSSITRLNYSDMEAAKNGPSIAYVQQGKRLGTMSYAELGVARASGKSIISIDENPKEKKDSILEKIASYEFNSKEESIDFLNQNLFISSKYKPIPIINKTQNKDEMSSIIFAGDYNLEVDEMLHRNLSFIEKNISNFNVDSDIENFSTKNDILVVNFDKHKKHNPEALFAMGLAYQTKVPIILLEGNQIPYPPLLGLARRVMYGENRFSHIKEYLKNLKSQHISDEALVYYNLMNKFNHS